MEESPSQGPAYWWAPGRGPMKALWVWRFFWTLKVTEKMGQQRFRAHRWNHQFFRIYNGTPLRRPFALPFLLKNTFIFAFLFLSLPATDTNIVSFSKQPHFCSLIIKKNGFSELVDPFSCGFCPGATWIHYVAAFYSFMPMTWGKLSLTEVMDHAMTSQSLFNTDFEIKDWAKRQ